MDSKRGQVACITRIVFCLFLLVNAPVFGQSSKVTNFQRCNSFAGTLGDLDTQHKSQATSAMQLVAQRADVLERLKACKRDLDELQARELVQQISLFQVELEKQALQIELNSIASQQNAAASAAQARAKEINASREGFLASAPASTKTFIGEIGAINKSPWLGAAPTTLPRIGDAPNVRALAAKWAQMVSLEGLGAQQLKELNAAQRITVERRLKIIGELQAVVLEMHRLQGKQFELFDKYFQLADIAGMRSRIEHRAALRELERADANNLGAAFVLAMTLSRLDRMDDSIALLNQLGASDALHGISLAARAEILMRKGEKLASRKDQSDALGLAKNDYRVRMLCAQADCVNAEYRSALADWEFALKHGTQEAAAQRALALIYVSLPSPTKHHLSLADEHSKLACALSVDENWGCQIARALALAVNGKRDEAAEYAEQATELAVGEQKYRCLAIADDIKAGKKVVWHFD